MNVLSESVRRNSSDIGGIRHVVFSAALLIILALPNSLNATLIAVPGDQATIQLGINASSDGDTVLVSPGTYTESISFGGRLITLRSSGGPAVTVLSGNGLSGSILSFASGESRSAVVEGFTFADALLPSGSGGAIVCSPGSATIRGNVFSNNQASVGGAILIMGGNPLIESNQFLSNHSFVDGGAIMIYGAAAAISQNLFNGNSSDAYCGAVFSRFSRVVASYNIFVDNHCPWKGGAYLLGQNSKDSVINNTFVGNRSDEGSGVLGLWYCDSAVVLNNILAFNVGPAIAQGASVSWDVNYNDVYGNPGGAYSGLSGGANDIAADPLFCDTLSADYDLDAASPCVGGAHDGGNIGARDVGCGSGTPSRIFAVRVGAGSNLHVVESNPLIQWRFFDPEGKTLATSELQVGVDDEWTSAEMWQPAPIIGPDSTIAYDGLPLQEGISYYVRIRGYNDSIWTEWKSTLFRTNTDPPQLQLYSPDEGEVVSSPTPRLSVSAALDVDADPLTVEFAVYSDVGLTDLVRSVSNVAMNEYYGASWYVTPALTIDRTYWWRARASDGNSFGPWSETRSFVENAFNDPPLPFALLLPSTGSIVNDITPSFSWESAVDLDAGDMIASYTLTISTDSTFQFNSQVTGLHNTAYLSNALFFGQRYWWTVRAIDTYGATTLSAPFTFYIPAPGDVDANGIFNLVDLVKLIDIVFRGTPVPPELLAIDVDGSCAIDVIDVVTLINFLFRGYPQPNLICSQSPSGHVIRVPEDQATIQLGINASSDGDTVLVSPGTYTESISFGGRLITLRSSGGPAVTVLSGNGLSGSILSFASGESRSAVVEGFTFADALLPSGSGGAIVCSPGSATIRGNVFSNNQASVGGAILIMGGNPLIESNQFLSNHSFVDGGAIMIYGAAAAISQNLFNGNSSDAYCGAVFSRFSRVVASYNIFVDNHCPWKGGAYLLGQNSKDSVINNTFVGNRSDEGSGVLGLWYCDSAVVLNNILAFNVGPAIAQGASVSWDVNYNDVYGNPGGAYSGLSGGANDIAADPLFCDTLSADYDLDAASPCVGGAHDGGNIGARDVGCGSTQER